MRWSWLVMSALMVGACSGSKEPEALPPQAPVAAVEAASVAGAPTDAPKAAGKRIGIGFAANMVGEIEPCGCKANPTGGLARRMTILDAWRHGNPDTKAPQTPPEQAVAKVEAGGQPTAAQADQARIDAEQQAKRAQQAPASNIGPVAFDGFLIVDAGDAFSDSPMLDGERLERAKHTAALIVQRFSEEGLSAQLIGDKDLGLGLEALKNLEKSAKYPFIATNIVDAKTQAPAFAKHTSVEVAGVRFGIIGLVSMNASRGPALTNQGLALLPPVDAAKAAIAELRKDHKDIVILALSQLSPAEEELVAKALPDIQLFLGGDQLSMSQGPQPVGTSFSLSGGQKGRQVAIAALTFEDPRGPAAPFVDPQLKTSLEFKLREATNRVQTYERLLADAEKQDAAQAQPPAPGAPPQPANSLRRRSPLAAYQNQLAAARADLALTESQLADLAKLSGDGAAKPASNTVALQLFNLGREVPDNEVVKAKVDAFRKDHPASGVH